MKRSSSFEATVNAGFNRLQQNSRLGKEKEKRFENDLELIKNQIFTFVNKKDKQPSEIALIKVIQQFLIDNQENLNPKFSDKVKALQVAINRALPKQQKHRRTPQTPVRKQSQSSLRSSSRSPSPTPTTSSENSVSSVGSRNSQGYSGRKEAWKEARLKEIAAIESNLKTRQEKSIPNYAGRINGKKDSLLQRTQKLVEDMQELRENTQQALGENRSKIAALKNKQGK